MNTKLAASLLLLASALSASHPAFAKTTRAQVQAELTEAIRSGNIEAPGDRGIKLNELYPSRYPAQQAQTSLTREQVQAELAEAIRTGNMLAPGSSGLKLNELHPELYPSKS